MSFVIRNLGKASEGATLSGLLSGHGTSAIEYLQWYDPDAFFGFGAAKWTKNLSKAMRFETFEAASEFWRQQSTVKPIRDDGKPNRPLTAYSVTFERVADDVKV